MATIDRTVPYETLIRHADDGTVQGAHHIKRRIVEIDGVRVVDQIGMALPIALAVDQPGEALTTVLGETLTAALASVERLTAEVAAAQDATARAEAKTAEAEARATAAEARTIEAEQYAATLEARIAAAVAAAQEMGVMVEAITPEAAAPAAE